MSRRRSAMTVADVSGDISLGPSCIEERSRANPTGLNPAISETYIRNDSERTRDSYLTPFQWLRSKKRHVFRQTYAYRSVAIPDWSPMAVCEMETSNAWSSRNCRTRVRERNMYANRAGMWFVFSSLLRTRVLNVRRSEIVSRLPGPGCRPLVKHGLRTKLESHVYSGEIRRCVSSCQPRGSSGAAGRRCAASSTTANRHSSVRRAFATRAGQG